MANKKNNTLLLVAGAGVIGWFLAPEKLKEQLKSGMPSIGIDFGGIGSLLDPAGGGGLGEITWPEFEWPSFPETWLPDLPDWLSEVPEAWGSGQDFIDRIRDLLGADGKEDKEVKTEPADTTLPPAPPYPKPEIPAQIWDEFTNLHPIVKNVVMGLAGVGGVYGAYKLTQAVAPAGKVVASSMAETFSRFLKGKSPVTTVKPTNIFKVPKGINPKLWAQWLKRTPLSKGLLGGASKIAGLGLAPLGVMDMIQEFDITKGWYNPIWEKTVDESEATYSPIEPKALPEFSYSRDKAPRRSSYGGIEKGHEPPDITRVVLSRSERENLMGF